MARSPVASEKLVRILRETHRLTGQLYIGFPIVRSSEAAHPIDALLLFQDGSLLLFDLVDGQEPGDYRQRQDDAYNCMEARLRPHASLMDKRKLRITINTISYAPGCSPRATESDRALVSSPDDLRTAIRKFNNNAGSDTLFREVLSALDGVTTIRLGRSERNDCSANTRCGKLTEIENAFVTLDKDQRDGAIETVSGVQRIRGLAGSGKTVVLARKAAYLHVLHPDWNIGVTFHTRSLKSHFRRLIKRFIFEDAQAEPNWNSLYVINAWGAPGAMDRTGVYHQFCAQHNLEFMDFREASSLYGRDEAFAGACRRALEKSRKPKPFYDVLLVDEAQDLPPSFLRLCHRFLKSPSRLVYCYDELQNLTGTSVPPPESIFGQRNGSPRVQLSMATGMNPKDDIILPKCYRTPGPVLATAHALGFGIYRRSCGDSGAGLVQMCDHPELWRDIGYKVVSGPLEPRSQVELARTKSSSPEFLQAHSSPDDLIQFKAFATAEEQRKWLVKAIQDNLEHDRLLPSDLMVIHPDPVSLRGAVGSIQQELYDRDIPAHLAGVDTDADIFLRQDQQSVTITSVHRAKGNEAGMVYVINAHEGLFSKRNLASIRNRLFTAITRTKAWVRVLGVGEQMEALCQEFSELKRHDFRLSFRYPSEEERHHLRSIHRDMSREEEAMLERSNRTIAGLVGDLESGTMDARDLNPDTRTKLLELLKQTQ
ncbi:MAG: ATP-binding domain-containing protein [Bacteroidota bacterium]|nr:ATP-binding domain-containing protein [Bacteroidota bacterium]